MTDAELKRLLTECLPDPLLEGRKGQLLYSGIDTLRPGTFYFVGFNPAADGTNYLLRPLQEVLLPTRNWSAYTCQCWMCKGECDPHICSKTGEARHQKNVQRIMCELGLKPEETFAANLIFVESHNIKELKADRRFFETCLEGCWRVHMRMLAEIRPKYIVCLGNRKGKRQSAFSFFQEKAVRTENYREEFTEDSRYRKQFDGTFNLDNGYILKAKVIGVKHPSYPTSPRGLRTFVGC